MALPFQSAAIVATQRVTSLIYAPILTRSAVAPPGSVPGGTICASPTGSPSGDGTPANPYDFATGNANLANGGTLLLFDGIYTLSATETTFIGRDAATLQTTVKAQTGARPILMGATGLPPPVKIRARHTIDGIWFGGGKDWVERIFQLGNDCVIQNCTIFNYYGGINEGDSTRDQYLNNRFVNNGAGALYHDLYINNSTTLSGEGAVIRNNVFVGGMGFKIHLWHDPKYCTIQNNFCTSGFWTTVCQGDAHTMDHNIGWNTPILIATPTNTTVSKNIVGPTTRFSDSTLGAGSTSDGNISVTPAPTWGTNPVQWTQAQWQANTGYSVAQIDDTVNNLTDAFTQSTANIWIDNGIEPLFTILAAVRDAVAGPVPWPDSPPQAPQAAIDRPSYRRGGIPLPHRHKGGRNRRLAVRSRRLTKR